MKINIEFTLIAKNKQIDCLKRFFMKARIFQILRYPEINLYEST